LQNLLIICGVNPRRLYPDNVGLHHKLSINFAMN